MAYVLARVDNQVVLLFRYFICLQRWFGADNRRRLVAMGPRTSDALGHDRVYLHRVYSRWKATMKIEKYIDHIVGDCKYRLKSKAPVLSRGLVYVYLAE